MSNKTRYRYNGFDPTWLGEFVEKRTFDRIKSLTVTTIYCAHHNGDCIAHIEITENTGKNNKKVRALGI
jgi:hypothetical protein